MLHFWGLFSDTWLCGSAQAPLRHGGRAAQKNGKVCRAGGPVADMGDAPTGSSGGGFWFLTRLMTEEDRALALYSLVSEKVVRSLRRLIRDCSPEQVHDVTHEVIREVLETPGWQHLTPARLNTWLDMLVNKHRKRFARNYLKEARIKGNLPPDELSSTVTLQPDDIANKQEEMRLVLAAFACLTPNEAILLREKYYGERSVNDIARRYGCSESAMTTRLSRARAALKKLLSSKIVEED